MSLLERGVHDSRPARPPADPTPGGGSASALAAAQGAALVAMVARLSPRDAPEAAAPRAGGRAERLQTVLADLVQADAQAFDAVLAAYRLPKATPEEQARRREAVQRALIAASEVPLQVSAHAVEVLQTAAGLVDWANPSTISDLGVAALLAEAGASGAEFNVVVNARSIKDAATAAALRARAAEAETAARRLRDAVVQAVARRLGSGGGDHAGQGATDRR